MSQNSLQASLYPSNLNTSGASPLLALPSSNSLAVLNDPLQQSNPTFYSSASDSALTAIAQGSPTPSTTRYPNTVTNGDFLIQGNSIATLVGDGADESTTWAFDFTTDPDFTSLTNSTLLASAQLTLTLEPTNGLITTDGITIQGLGSIVQPIRELPVGETSTITIDLLDYFSPDTVVQAIQRNAGRLSTTYQDDAIVSFAQLKLSMFDSGIFTVGDTGQVSINFLADGSAYEGELAIFSLEGMGQYKPGSTAFIQEATRRALTNSNLGHVAISDPVEGARFKGILGAHEGRDWNTGKYSGNKTFLMRPGDRFGFMLVPDGWTSEVFRNPEVGGSQRPLFSMSTTPLSNTSQFTWVVATQTDNNVFAFEDLSLKGYSDRDYNDVIFQVQGAIGNAPTIDRVINPDKDWRKSSVGAAMIAHLELAQDLGFTTDPVAVGNGVWFLGEGIPPDELRIIRPHSVASATTINTNQIWAGTELNLDGNGFTVGIWETGEPGTGNWRVRNTHEKLMGRTVLVDTDRPTGFSDHATQVAGVLGAALGGAGIGAANARGMASQVNLRSYSARNDIAEMGRDAGLLIASNHSYGGLRGWNRREIDPKNSPNVNTAPMSRTDIWLGDRGGDYISSGEDHGFGKYGSDAQALDQVLFQHPYLLSVWSAGNDRNDQFTNANGNNSYVTYFGSNPRLSGFNWSGRGWYLVPTSIAPEPDSDGNSGTGFDSLPDEQSAKNTLVVGAIDSAGLMSTFSSWGPTDDGRIKPDVVANGVNVLAASSASDTAYALGDGTSLAAPSVTGTAVLLIQHYRNLFGNLPRSATTKGLLIHTAADAGRPGPDYAFGWGVVDANRGAQFLINATAPNPTSYVREETYTGTERTMTLWSDGTTPLKATLAWTDPAGNPQGKGLDVRTPVLVNDLDLWITGPDGVHYPWTLNPLNPTNPADQITRNHLDNVEQVLIPNPVAGEYTIHVGHSGRSFEQNYSLLVNGGTIRQGNLVVTIRRLKGDFDPGPSDSDFYTRVSFDNGNTWLRSPQKTGNDIQPNWTLSQLVGGATIPITIQVYDNDSFLRGQNDHVDIDPDRGDRDINLLYNLFTGEISGDLLEIKDQWFYSQGGGDSSSGEIWFTVGFEPA